jgi:4a-hydroxytetrahydrobiopterin dehydratase
MSLLPKWELVGATIGRLFEFESFTKSMEFVNQVAENADAVNHHPDIDIRYNKVRLLLTTHDAGGLTLLDMEMAAAADDIAGVIAQNGSVH